MDYYGKISNFASEEAKEEYWKAWLASHSHLENEEDWLLRSFFEVMKLSIENHQYSIPYDEKLDVTRVVKVNLRLSRDLIEKMFGVKTYSIYGNGIYILMDGVILSSGTRDRTGYDTLNKGRKSYFDTSCIDDEVLDTHDIRLATPALGGLFVPKKSQITNWMSSNHNIQYFDIMKD